MAINKVIAKPPKSHGGLRNCIEYVLRFNKVSDELFTVTGPYEYDQINYDFVFQSFLHEKKLWNKDYGRMCIHNVISWHKDEDITPQEAFTFGLEFAEKWFSGFQTVVAVHQDKEHIHCHFVTNSVSYENGKKYHSSKKDLEAMKQMTNKMCKEKGFTVAEKGKHFDGSDIEPGEVITWNKNKYQLFMKDTKQSFVWACAMAVINAVRNCFSKEVFISRMQESGWTVHWSDKRKHITFENKDGQKVRDSNLAKTFQLDIGRNCLMNLYSSEKTQERTRLSSSNTTDSLKNLIQEQSERLEIALSINQELLQQNQNLQEESHSLRIQLCETQRLNQKLASENDQLRNRNGLMLRKQQEQLERKIEDVQTQNSKLEHMVNLSNVSAVETAEKERDSALGKLKAEQRKKEAIEKGHKEEVGKINLKFNNQLKKLKREIDFWRTVSILLIIASISVTYWFIR